MAAALRFDRKVVIPLVTRPVLGVGTISRRRGWKAP
jgi:hypothetical protein